MNPYAETINKHITNFNQFSSQFTKVFIPIVETAIKMSKEEPVSAYSVYKAANNLSENNKKLKKMKNSPVKKKISKNKVKKLSTAAASKASKVSTKMRKGATTTNNNTGLKKKGVPSKQTIENHNKSKSKNYKGSEIINLVEQLCTDDSKKLTKADQKKKKDLKHSRVNQTEMSSVESVNDEHNDSQVSSMGLTIPTSEISSDDYTKDESFMGFHNSETEASSSTNDDNNQAVDYLGQDIVYKSYKKRGTELDPSIGASNNNAKKSKKSNDCQATPRKSVTAIKDINDMSTSRLGSLACVDYNSINSTPKPSSTTTFFNIKLEHLSPPENIVKLNSIEEGKRAFKWLLNPVTIDDFFEKYWEHNACLVKRQQSNYFKNLISFKDIDQMLLNNHVEFTKNIDVTSYKKGIRETHNPEGRALPPMVWDHYGQGCSIRLLNPQTFLPSLYRLNTTLQEYFHCLVGANAYLTPPNSQGFAPHYDDIEAFVLQIEGRKRWKLYKPRKVEEILPRDSSKNFTQQEIGEPVMEQVLEPGDVLYFPRGTIHQACTEPGYHSLHITLSVYQKQSFADLFEKMLPIMLEKAIASSVNLRRGLPLHAWHHAGLAFSENSTKERADLTKQVTKLMHKFIRDMPLEQIMDAGIDQLAKKFQHEALPPHILPAEKLRTVYGSRSTTNERGECVCDYDIDERTNVRLLRANILRLVEEDKKLRIYYYLDNSKEYCEYEPNFIEIEAMEAASVEVLIKSYPHYVGVSELPLDSDEQKVNLATALWERGLLMMEKSFR